MLIVHFTVACLVAKSLNRSEAKGDLVMIQTLLLFKCKFLCYHANYILLSITTRSPSASPQIKGLATKYTTVKCPTVLWIGKSSAFRNDYVREFGNITCKYSHISKKFFEDHQKTT